MKSCRKLSQFNQWSPNCGPETSSLTEKMRAPKLPSMFRNVRSTPRQFNMRSPHFDRRAVGWAERKSALDAAYEREQTDRDGTGDATARPQRVKLRRGMSADTRRQDQKKRSIRILAIIAVLLFILWYLDSWMAK